MTDEAAEVDSGRLSRVTPTIIGRYALFSEIAAGGMATVHLGRLLGPVGFARTVAIKRLHPHLARDPEFVSMFLDEARLAARVRHPNVVPTIDVVAEAGELFLVMEFVQGESLARLIRVARTAKTRIPPNIVVSAMIGVLHGLHAAHEAKSERGQPLNIVHRDVSPQNVIVGADGVARIFDFGIAKAIGRLQITRDGEVKGKYAYMAVEQMHGTVTRKTDLYAASVVLWEALTGARLFRGDSDGEILNAVLSAPVPPPSAVVPELPAVYDAIVMRGLERDPALRFSTAREMALALEAVGPFATASEVGSYVEQVAREVLDQRAGLIAEIESTSRVGLITIDRSTETVAETPPARAEPNQPSPPPGRGRRGLAIGAIALASIGLVVVATTFGATHKTHDDARTSATNATSASKSVETSAPPSTTSTTTSALASSIAPSSPSPSTTSTPKTKTVKTSAPGIAAKKPSIAQCDPPFVIDAKGAKRYKPECL